MLQPCEQKTNYTNIECILYLEVVCSSHIYKYMLLVFLSKLCMTKFEPSIQEVIHMIKAYTMFSPVVCVLFLSS